VAACYRWSSCGSRGGGGGGNDDDGNTGLKMSSLFYNRRDGAREARQTMHSEDRSLTRAPASLTLKQRKAVAN
jgi:hypothetical protein